MRSWLFLALAFCLICGCDPLVGEQMADSVPASDSIEVYGSDVGAARVLAGFGLSRQVIDKSDSWEVMCVPTRYNPNAQHCGLYIRHSGAPRTGPVAYGLFVDTSAE